MKFSTNRWPVLKSSNFISQLTEMAREQCWEKVSRQFWVSDKNIKGRCFQWEGVLVSFNQLKLLLGWAWSDQAGHQSAIFQMKGTLDVRYGLCFKCRWWRDEDFRNMLIYYLYFWEIRSLRGLQLKDDSSDENWPRWEDGRWGDWSLKSPRDFHFYNKKYVAAYLNIWKVIQGLMVCL